MDDNMIKLHDLIKETNALINNLEKSTELVKAKYNKSKQIILDDMRSCLRELIPIVSELHCDVKTPLKSKSHYGDVYYIELRATYAPLVFSGKECCLDRIPWTDDYEKICRRQRDRMGLYYDLNKVLDGWDRDSFEAEFAKEVQNILIRRAKLANQNYSDMKAKLNKEM